MAGDAETSHIVAQPGRVRGVEPGVDRRQSFGECLLLLPVAGLRPDIAGGRRRLAEWRRIMRSA
ncbi:hypothetical protein [Consotaella aegiceratis]|uniref:hypothetical protein n=1 Tax=Consotaella aegiceratis TaxID=3097961 RepID=UPI002F3FC083